MPNKHFEDHVSHAASRHKLEFNQGELASLLTTPTARRAMEIASGQAHGDPAALKAEGDKCLKAALAFPAGFTDAVIAKLKERNIPVPDVVLEVSTTLHALIAKIPA